MEQRTHFFYVISVALLLASQAAFACSILVGLLKENLGFSEPLLGRQMTWGSYAIGYSLSLAGVIAPIAMLFRQWWAYILEALLFVAVLHPMAVKREFIFAPVLSQEAFSGQHEVFYWLMVVWTGGSILGIAGKGFEMKRRQHLSKPSVPEQATE